MVDTGELENYLNEKSAKKGDIVEIKSEGEIVEQDGKFGKQRVLNIPVLLNGREMIWSPKKTATNLANKIFDSTDTKNWVGKKFQVAFVKMMVNGEPKDIIIPEKL